MNKDQPYCKDCTKDKTCELKPIGGKLIYCPFKNKEEKEKK